MNIVDKLPRHPTKKYATREIKDLKYIAIHHSATTTGDPYSFANHHINNNGWPGIGYHYVIMKDGTRYKTQNITTMSYHVGYYNRQAIGICLVGDFEKEKPTEAQYQALRELLQELSIYNLEIKGHKDFMNRTCPGKNFDFSQLKTKTELEKFIAELQSLIERWK